MKWSSLGNAIVPCLIVWLMYSSARNFYNVCYPKFPEFDKNHRPIPKHGPIVKDGTLLNAELFVKNDVSLDRVPVANFNFRYSWEHFAENTHVETVKVNVSRVMMMTGDEPNVWLHAHISLKSGRLIAVAKGHILKYMTPPEERPKYKLLSGELCPAPVEMSYSNTNKVPRGVPKMQVRLVHDTTHYPQGWVSKPYPPRVYVDEFWLTNDQLVTLNDTDLNTFETEVHFDLMSSPRWRFQMHMERSFKMNAEVLGEDSEEMLQMRDLFANTNPYLLIATMVVSFLHLIFEYLAFKNDVSFWQRMETADIQKFISVKSIVGQIFCEIILTLYLYDENSNLLVVAISVVAVFVDLWKVTRVMRFGVAWVGGVLPVPCLRVRPEVAAATAGESDFDGLAIRWLSLALTPIVLIYAAYSLVADCHRGTYSFMISTAAALVYTLGFVLMTPQLFINYKRKTVAYLPWRKFIYRAINTFIDDLFAFIIKMPTMHRMSCFRDDVVFFVYLYQRHIYAVDKTRSFDDDGDHDNVTEAIEAKKEK